MHQTAMTGAFVSARLITGFNMNHDLGVQDNVPWHRPRFFSEFMQLPDTHRRDNDQMRFIKTLRSGFSCSEFVIT